MAGFARPPRAVILLHNHPSGDPQPSYADRVLTRRLVEAGDILGIRVLDHVVIGSEGFYSFVDAGALRQRSPPFAYSRSMNTQTDVQLLKQPFPEELIKTRKGSHGQELSYVEGVHYIARLNEVFGAAWSFRILHQQVTASEVVVRVELEVNGAVKQAFGGSRVTAGKDGEIVSLADDMKAAATDGLKKSASLFGVGLDLYGSGRKNGQNGNGASERRPASTNGANGVTGGIQRNRLTAKQLRAIYAIGHGQGLTDEELKKSAVDAFGSAPEFLSMKDASAFIESLQS